MTNAEAKQLVRMLRDKFYGDELNDFEILDRALASCDSTGFAFIFLILYYQGSEAWPEFRLWLLLGCASGMAVAYIFFRRQRRVLLKAREHFTRHAPKNFNELEILENEKSA